MRKQDQRFDAFANYLKVIRCLVSLLLLALIVFNNLLLLTLVLNFRFISSLLLLNWDKKFSSFLKVIRLYY